MRTTTGSATVGRLGRPLLVLVIAVATFLVVVPRPALGCSCMAPGDLETVIAESPAAVVGTMMDRKESGLPDFDQAAVYRIEVEEWVKGDLGDVIDVYSASDGAGCGIETPVGGRIGLFLQVDGNHLTSNLCRTASPDALLAAAKGPVISETGIPRLLVGGWSTPSLKVLDETGALITRLESRVRPDELADGARTSISLCPGGRRLAHRTSEGLAIWDLTTMEMASRTELPGLAAIGVFQISCRSEDGSVVWYVIEGVGGAAVVDSHSGDPISTFAEPTASLGLTHAISYDYEGRVVNRHDLATGETILLYQNLTGELRGVYPAPNPVDGTTAMVEVRYREDGPVDSTVFVYDEAGVVVSQIEIPMEASVPAWLDADTIAVGASDYETGEKRLLYVIDASSGGTAILDDWQPWETTGTDEEVFGIVFGGIWHGDLRTGEVEQIGTIADESAAALLVFEDAEAIDIAEVSPPAPVGGVVPPLTGEDGIEVVGSGGPVTPETVTESNNLARALFVGIAGVVIVAGLLAWRRDRPHSDSSTGDGES